MRRAGGEYCDAGTAAPGSSWRDAGRVLGGSMGKAMRGLARSGRGRDAALEPSRSGSATTTDWTNAVPWLRAGDVDQGQRGMANRTSADLSGHDLNTFCLMA